MPRHREPTELSKFKGADKKNPQRYRKVIPKSTLPLGNYPDHLTPLAKKAWFELESYAIAGVLTGADRVIMEVTSELLGEFRLNPAKFQANKYGHLIGCLARLGMSPSDRIKLGTNKKPEGNEFDGF